MIEESTALDKPRRHWRVTKADLEGQVVAAAEAAERRAAECAELRGDLYESNRRLRQWRLVAWWNGALASAVAVAVVWL